MNLLILTLSLAVTLSSFAQHPTHTLERRQFPEPTPTSDPFNPGAISRSENAAFRNNQALYIRGGGYGSTVKNVTYRHAFYKLNLSFSCIASQAPWAYLSLIDPTYNQYIKERMVLSRDSGVLYAGSREIQAYATEKNEWKRKRIIETSPVPFELDSIMDLDSGIVYNLGSCNSGTCLDVADECFLSTFETTNGKIGGEYVPWESVKNLTYQSTQGIYSEVQKSLFFLHGAEATLSTVQGKIVITEYNLGSKILTKFATNGAKLILAGGGKPPQTANSGASVHTNVALSDMHMLDVATATWTKLPDATSSSYYKPTYAVSADSLILYGGYSAHTRGLADGTIVTNGNESSIFAIKNNICVNQYKSSATSGAVSETSGALSSYSNVAFVVFLIIACGM
ncbi:hypothetical protein BGZ93_011129 [Podila epicladia]|nr:hypothetical protein BGZ92_000445 [Podila epicladia]KAG0087141.1 hypothetical protein BGZ93_011129 [Podila epicladia]